MYSNARTLSEILSCLRTVFYSAREGASMNYVAKKVGISTSLLSVKLRNTHGKLSSVYFQEKKGLSSRGFEGG